MMATLTTDQMLDVLEQGVRLIVARPRWNEFIDSMGVARTTQPTLTINDLKDRARTTLAWTDEQIGEFFDAVIEHHDVDVAYRDELNAAQQHVRDAWDPARAHAHARLQAARNPGGGA